MRRILVTGLPLMLLGGCLSFGPKVPASLLTLTSAETVPAGATRTARDGETVAVAVPSVPQALMTARVPVSSGPTAVAYLKDAQWVDGPARLFRNLLAETIAARTGRVVLDPRDTVASPGYRIGGRLLAFGYDAPSGMAVISFDATLLRGKSTTAEERRFEAKLPAAAMADAVGVALNQGANQVAGEVADWVGK